MEDKLAYLAAKEEEMRKINEQLDQCNEDVLKEKPAANKFDFDDDDDEGLEESKASYAQDDDEEEDEMAAFKGVTLKVDEITKGQTDDYDDDDYENEQFDDSKAGASYAKQTSQASNAKSFASDADSGLLQQKYKVLQDEHTEQTKTVNFQKAKIAALQTELQETLEKMAENEIELELVEKESNKAMTAGNK